LVRKLNEKGVRPRILVHDPTTVKKALEGLDCEVFKGDVNDIGSLLGIFEGVETVIHCAAYISITPGTIDKLRKVNVEGVINVLAACRKNNVKKLVHISSIEALGDPGQGVTATEEMGFNPDRAMIEYGVTKAEASLIVQRAAEEGMNVCTVCPVGVIGPHDYRPSQMGTMIIDFNSGKLPAYPGYGGFDWVDSRDVADGIILAVEKGKKGEVYLLTAGHATNDKMMGILEAVTGKSRPKIKLPYWLMYTVGFFAEFYYKAAGKEAVITRGSARILKSDLKASSEKAKKELGFSPRSVSESFRDHFEWLRENS
jgi:dihydroflavonol-4-reductase